MGSPSDWQLAPDAPLCGGTAVRRGSGPHVPWEEVATERDVVQLVQAGTLQATADGLPEGAALVLAEGSEHTGTLRLKNRQVVAGEGTGAKLLPANQNGHWLDLRGLSGCRLHNLAIEGNAPSNFYTSLSADGARGLTITGCAFTNIGSVGFGWTVHAVAARNIHGLWVENCTFSRSQLKIGGPGGSTELIRVRDCVFNEPYNFGISVVVRHEFGMVRDVVVERCDFHNPISKGALYIGDDHAEEDGSFYMEMRNVVVRDILVDGDPAPGGTNNVPIRLVPCAVTRDVLLERIQVDTEVSSAIAIVVNSRRQLPDDVRALTIRDITATNAVRITAPAYVTVENISGPLWLYAHSRFGPMHVRRRNCPDLFLNPRGGTIDIEEY